MTARSGVVVLVAAASLVSAGAYGWRTIERRGCPGDATALLLHASASSSSIHPRWTGCFDHPVRSLRAAPLLTTAQVRGAVALFELSAEERRRDGVQALGIARILSGESEGGIAALTTDGGDDPDRLSNLAGAYLVSAARSGSARDAALALDHASHALALAPSHLAALFNQALALTMFGLNAEARSAWRHYLALDGTSDWSTEARTQLATLTGAPAPAAAFDERFARSDWDATTMSLLCQSAPQTCRERLEEHVLPEWGRATLDGDTAKAASLLARADTLATALRTRGDPLDAYAVDDLRQALQRHEPRLGDAAAGLVAYGSARAAFEDDHESIPLFLEAERRLDIAGNPLHGWAHANRIYAEFNTYGSRLDAVQQELHGDAAAALSHGYGALAGRLLYLESLTFANRANYAGAEPLFRESRDMLEKTRESGHLAAVHVVVADTRMRLGEIDAGWQALRDAVGTMSDIASARRRYAILLNVGLWMTDTGMPYAAIQVLTSARDTAIATDQVLRVAESSLTRSVAYARIGNLPAARADLEVARPDPAKNGRWGTGVRARHEYLAGVAEVEREANPRVAIAAATEALSFFGEWQYAERVAPLYLVRGRAYAAAGDRAHAEEDFTTGIATYEMYRQTIPTARQRLLSQDVVWDLYEERLQLAARRSPEAAFAAAEEARGRTLVEAMPGARVLRSVAELQHRLTPESRIVYYALLPRELLIWVVASEGVTFERVGLDRAALERRVEALADALQRDAPDREWRPLSEQLFETVLRPVERALPSGTTITIVPDGALHRLPFAALHDARGGHYVVEEHALTTAPSATLLAWQLQQPHHAGRPSSVFAVTDPVPAGALTALPGAAREGRSIARLYDSADVVSRERATKAAFLLSAPRADVVHFAGHAVANPRYPLMGHLQFSAESAVAASPTLDASEIAAMHLERTQLVVLAACTTAGGQVRRGEGVLSLARPFLIAGAPAVVATLWDIDDAASAAFLTSFHEQFVQNGDAALALRQAQRWAAPLMRPSRWAAFVLVGQSEGGS